MARVLSLMFTKGYGGAVDIAEEAIRLARELTTLTEEPEVAGVLALMLLRHDELADLTDSPIHRLHRAVGGGGAPRPPAGGGPRGGVVPRQPPRAAGATPPPPQTPPPPAGGRGGPPPPPRRGWPRWARSTRACPAARRSRRTGTSAPET